MAAILPRALTPKDVVAIVSTSSPAPAPEAEVNQLISYFAGRGHRVRVMPHTLAATGYLAGPAIDRAADLMAAFADAEVGLIVPATGGKGSAQMLSLLDYELIKRNPKIMLGLSDPSIVINAITARTGLITLHGPTGYDFSRPTVEPRTEADFWRMATSNVTGTEASESEWRVINGAGTQITGPVFGGHLGTIRALIGTQWQPQLNGAILILEDVFVPWVDIDAALTHLRLAGVFNQIAALVFGVPVDCSSDGAPESDWDAFILRCVGSTCPILTNVQLGHTSRKLPFPIGARVHVDLNPNRPVIRYCESAVFI